MRRLNLLLLTAVLLAACSQPAPRTPTQRPPLVLPPTWTIAATGRPIHGPTNTPAPTRTIAPIETPAATTAFTTTDGYLSLQIPSNWITRTGQLEMVSNQQYQMDYASFSAPGLAPQPTLFVLYRWPNMGAITNENAWQQAYALLSLTVKVCPMTLTTGGPLVVGGEPGQYIGYKDSCGVQGELIGLVHNGVNYAIMLEAPRSVWDTWRFDLHDMLSTLKLLR